MKTHARTRHPATLARRLKLAIVPLIGIAGLLCLATAIPASASAASAILNDHSGLCISTATDGDAQQSSCNTSADENFRPTEVSGEFFQIENGDDSCMDVKAGGAGTVVELGVCENDSESRWLKGACSSGYCIYISAFDSPYVMSVSGDSTKSGAHLVLEKSSSAADQKWFWTDTP